MTFQVLLGSYMLVLLHSLILRVVVGPLISPRRLEWCVIFFFFFCKTTVVNTVHWDV